MKSATFVNDACLSKLEEVFLDGHAIVESDPDETQSVNVLNLSFWQRRWLWHTLELLLELLALLKHLCILQTNFTVDYIVRFHGYLVSFFLFFFISAFLLSSSFFFLILSDL